MQQLDRIQARIHGLHELGELIRALRVLAAARLAEAQATLPAAKAWRASLRSAWSAVPPGPEPPTSAAPLYLLIGAEHGFTGAYAERLLGAVPGSAVPLALVGRRALARALERKRKPTWSEELSTRPATVPDLARRLAARIRAEARPVRLIHAVYRHGSRFELGQAPLWPLGAANRPASPPPRTQLPPDRLRTGIADLLLVAELSVALLEALASENAARMTVLNAAEHTLQGKLDGLKVEERAARQGAITAELLDVVTGAEAQRR